MLGKLTAEIARSLLDYDPETGVVTRKRIFGRRHAGDAVGTPTYKGYLHGYIYDRNYTVHRVIWLMVHGQWPAEQIDHINHDRADNRLENLRECTNAENRQNIHLSGYGSSGHLGVHVRGDKWSSSITLNGERHYVGLFDTWEEARKAYLAAKLQTHAFVASDLQLQEAANF